MKISYQRKPDSAGGYIVAEVSQQLLTGALPQVIIREIAEKIAERYIAEHYQEIVALIKQEPIATLVVAEAAAEVRRTLAEKIPDKVLEVI